MAAQTKPTLLADDGDTPTENKMLLTAAAFLKMTNAEIILMQIDADDAANDLAGTPHTQAATDAREISHACLKELTRRALIDEKEVSA